MVLYPSQSKDDLVTVDMACGPLISVNTCDTVRGREAGEEGTLSNEEISLDFDSESFVGAASPAFRFLSTLEQTKESTEKERAEERESRTE